MLKRTELFTPQCCNRSLRYLPSGFGVFKCFVGKRLELTFLKLRNFGEEESELLISLCKLKELSIHIGSPLYPLVLTSTAELTKLELTGSVVSHQPKCTSCKIAR